MLNTLICPSCKTAFDSREVDDREDGIEYGLLKCPCSVYPVVVGIPILRNGEFTDRITELVRHHEFDTALWHLLEQASPALDRPLRRRAVTFLRRGGNLLPERVMKYLRVVERQSSSDRMSEWKDFREAVTGLYGSESREWYFDEYLLYRPFGHSFWNLHALLPLAVESDGPFLDYGGGAGHGPQLISRLTDRPTWNVDTDFGMLFLSRWHVAPNTRAVLVSGENDLPFEAGTFGTTINMDGLHYVNDKYRTGGELARVTREAGEILLLHQHTGEEHPYSGSPVSAERYRESVPREGLLVPESTLLNSFLDAEDRFEVQDHAHASGNINLVVSPDVTESVELTKTRNPLVKWEGPATINPLYELRSSEGKHQLARKTPSEGYRSEFAFSMNRTEATYTIDSEFRPDQLLTRGILTLLPAHYTDGPELKRVREFGE